jgi:hypothetical protein
MTLYQSPAEFQPSDLLDVPAHVSDPIDVGTMVECSPLDYDDGENITELAAEAPPVSSPSMPPPWSAGSVCREVSAGNRSQEEFNLIVLMHIGRISPHHFAGDSSLGIPADEGNNANDKPLSYHTRGDLDGWHYKGAIHYYYPRSHQLIDYVYQYHTVCLRQAKL